MAALRFQSKLVVHCTIVLGCGLPVAGLGHAQLSCWHREQNVCPSALTEIRVAQQSPRPATFAAEGEPQNADTVLQGGDSTSHAELTAPEIVDLQRLLNELGFDPGAADGTVGPKTRAAIRKFQELHDLQVDGSPTPALLDSLRQSERARRQLLTDEPARSPAHPAGLSRIVTDDRSGRPDTTVVPDEPSLNRNAPQPRPLERLLANDFFGATSIEAPWRIAGERFEPHWRLGMRSADEESGVYQALQEAWFTAAGLLGYSRPARRSAELYAERRFSGPFTLKVGFRTNGNGGRLLIGPYLGRSRQSGYRVVYSPENGHRVSLLWLQNGRSSTLARLDAPLRLRRGVLHELVWSRTSERGLEAAIDGKAIFRLEDPHPETAFDGITIEAQNGAFSIASIELLGTPAAGNLSHR